MAATIEVARLVAPLVAETSQFTKALSDANRQAQGFGSGIQRQTQSAGASFKNIAAGVAAGGAALMAFTKTVGLVTSAIHGLTSAATGFVTEGMQVAGRFQEMEFAALAVGRAMGLQEDQIRGAVDEINELGIRYDVAAKTVATFAKNQIDLAKGTDLVRIAQGAAIVMGEDSSATMERLAWAVTTHNTMMLRRMGIMTDLTAAEDRYAASIGKAREELTDSERIQADVNAVIAAGGPLLDVYAAAMESPTKQLRSLTQRELPELKAALGAPFLDAWSIAIGAIRDFVQALTNAMQEGGALHPLLINLGAGLSILADQFAAALGWVTNFVTGLDTTLGDGLARTAENMLTWGANMVASLAEGIISAASTVLVGALNFIGDMLSLWLGPGSPPKVAPNLGQWGVQAMAEWLHGFTKADFSILEKIQAPLRQILEGPAFVSISGDIIRSMAMTGTIGEEIFAKIARAAGAYGQEIANLIRLQWDLIGTTKELETAEELVKQRQQELIDVQDEYYRLRAKRAPPEVLKAKEDEIKAAQENLSLAEEQAKDAKDRLKTLEGQADLQDLLVKQLMMLGGLAMPSAAAMAAGAGAAAVAKMPKMPKMPKPEAIRPEFVMPEPAAFDIASRISQAIDDAKAIMEEKLTGIFEPVTTTWDETLLPALDEVSLKFQEVWGLIGQAWDEFWGAFSPYLVEMHESLMEFRDEIQPALVGAWRSLKDLWDEVADSLGLADMEASGFFKTLGDFAGSEGAKFFEDFLDAIVTGVEDFKEATAWVKEGIQGWTTAIDAFNAASEIMPWTEWLTLGNIIKELTLPEWLRPGSATPFEDALHGISGAVTEEMQPAFADFSTMLLEQWAGIYSYLVEETWPMMQSEWVTLMLLMGQYFRDFVNAVLDGARKMVEAIDRVTAALGRTKIATEAAEKAFKSLTSQSILDRFDKLMEKINRVVRKMRDLEKAANAAAKAVKAAAGAGGGGGGGAPAPAPGLQRGMWNVPRTMTATLHRGERVLPAGLAEASRAGLGGMTILAPVFLDSRDFVDAAGVVDYAGIGQRLKELERSL